MLFSSLTFLFIFLPLFLFVYFIVPQRWQNFVLFGFSLLFYAWGEVRYIWVLLLSALTDYSVGRGLSSTHHPLKRKALLALSLCVNLFLLFWFKYSDFFAQLLGLSWLKVSHHLPIGISFYTFQTLSYSIDVYRHQVQPVKSFIDFGAYISMFMQLIAGPIVRYKDIEHDLLNTRQVSLLEFKQGFQQFILGLAMKVLLANQIGLLWDQISGQTGWTMMDSWLGILAFALQIYFDFNGYSQMAIGLGKMIGLHFPENFRDPYAAIHVTDFWRRWHISLSTWFRDYVYIPLGGNRVSFWRWTANLVIVWALTGLWHGASLNFLCWGLYYAMILWLEKIYLKKNPHFHNHLYTLFFVAIGWVLFAFEDFSQIVTYLQAMLGFNGWLSTQSIYLLTNYALILTLGSLMCLPAVNQKMKSLPFVISCVLLLLSICFLIENSYNPFLYFRF